MANFYPTQSASRFQKNNNVTYTGSGTVVSTNFSSQTRQIRVVTNITGGVYLVTANSTTDVTTVTGGMFIAANNYPEYFTVSPGQIAAMSSSSTSSGVIAITEMTN
jgi:uncharacterized protein YaiE (UPF0345 family)